MKELTKQQKESTAKILEKALAMMNDGGKHWIKGKFTQRNNGEDSYCSLGALMAGSGNSSLGLHRAHGALISTIKDEYGKLYLGNVVYWNDDPDRKWKDVKYIFNKTIDSLRGENQNETK